MAVPTASSFPSGKLWWWSICYVFAWFFVRELFIRHNEQLLVNSALVALDAILVSFGVLSSSYFMAFLATIAYDSPAFLLRTTAYVFLLQLVGKTWLTADKLLDIRGVTSDWPGNIAMRLGADALTWLYGAIEISLLLLWAYHLQRGQPTQSMTPGKLAVLGVMTVIVWIVSVISKDVFTPFMDFLL